jgi:hypothetical protein
MDIHYKQTGISDFFRLTLKRAVYWIVPFLLLSSCSEKDDVTVIRQLIEQGAKLAENQDINGLMKLTTGDFIALPGKHDNREVKTIIWLAFKHYRKFKILYPEPVISLQTNSDSALATVTFLIVKKEQSLPDLNKLWRNPEKWLKELGENADLYQLKLEWLKKNGNWLVKEARLAPFRGLGFGK